ncbi:methylmalonyl Co-A mutase-associated GTPase MeaB [Hyphomicrobium sp.]|uniref:methylmalonyl Co-A mutase-associated GTPase MeaB n=1 Tax=Hyphomicrobium sp. TaxID=82 RepID=UPI0025B88071|nr:methylmalonyl Co-A mutase-associated GTPase MeaB [Hyphomicrobium sp.]MCC7253274.1 methylmalonyl Co-A mutase-associated GTPase MeaB [Hyphomicrobium sp.]
MKRFVPSSELVVRASRGEIPAISRLITRAEMGLDECRPALAEIYRKAGKAHVIGITGVPGSGKSTLVANLAAQLRRRNKKVAIIAVDPSSPYSGGSILGDRIRMTELASDPGVYIRSMATRGAVGGMARSTLDAVDILDVGGFDTIIIETVGVGQDEVEIAKASHTTVVVSAPGLGDEIQAIKAGMLEIADIHVVSKCDRSDSNKLVVDLKQMLTLGLASKDPKDWLPTVIGVSSYNGTGIDELATEIERHRAASLATGRAHQRELAIASFRLEKTAETLLIERFLKTLEPLRPALASTLCKRERDPYSAANELVSNALPQSIDQTEQAARAWTRRR